MTGSKFRSDVEIIYRIPLFQMSIPVAREAREAPGWSNEMPAAQPPAFPLRAAAAAPNGAW